MLIRVLSQTHQQAQLAEVVAQDLGDAFQELTNERDDAQNSLDNYRCHQQRVHDELNSLQARFQQQTQDLTAQAQEVNKLREKIKELRGSVEAEVFIAAEHNPAAMNNKINNISVLRSVAVMDWGLAGFKEMVEKMMRGERLKMMIFKDYAEAIKKHGREHQLSFSVINPQT